MTEAEMEKKLQEFHKLNQTLIKTAAQADLTLKTCLERYQAHHLQTINEILAHSIAHLKKVETLKSPEDIICLQARFAKEVNQQINVIAERFMQLTLGNQENYNDWLKSHCDLATD